MNKNDLKTLVHLLILFAILALIAFGISIFENKNMKLNGSVIVDNNLFLEYKQKEWKNLQSIDNIEMEKFDIYNKNSYAGQYKITETNGRNYFFDDNYESVDISSPYIAFSNKSSMAIKKCKKVKFSNEDYNEVAKYLKKINVSYSGEYNTKEKYETNLNNNNKKDYIYIVSNQLYSDDNILYLVFAKIDNKYIEIDNQINKTNLTNYEVGWILNTSSNNYSDILLSYTKFESNEYYLYRFNKGKYAKLLPEE